MSPNPPQMPDDKAIKHVEDGDDDEDEEIRRHLAEGWQVGFEVHMRGVGRERVDNEHHSQSDAESSDWESDPPSEPENNEEIDSPSNHNGYEALPSSPIRELDDDASPRHIPPSLHAEFERLRLRPAPEPAYENEIRHNPRAIELDKARISDIRSAMSAFSLPPPHPSWANERLSDVKLLEMMHSIQTTDK